MENQLRGKHVQLSNSFFVYWVAIEIFDSKFNGSPEMFWATPETRRLQCSDVVVQSRELIKCRVPVEILITMALEPVDFHVQQKEPQTRMERSLIAPFCAADILKTWRTE